jgi:cytochrome o ubiquinol oxidase operon protein cyoD
MSASANAAHAGHGDADVHVTRKDYVLGFVLAAALTIAPFWLVMAHPLANPVQTAIAVIVFAAAQVLVQMVYFLHMNSRSQGGWTMLALLFTVLMVGIVLSGSLWVMYHLNANMMPMSPLEARQAP